MTEAGIKITSNDSFIPITLLENIIEQSDIKIETIEESDSELFFKTYHGKGTIIFKNGSEYFGNVKYGIMESTAEEKSYMKFKNGTTYFGDMKLNKITGFGEYTFPEGSIYKGEVLNGLRHGQGIYENQKENLYYDGFWQNGLKHGKGVLTIGDMVYDGEFFEGSKHNFGKLKWTSSKNYYEGEFKENQISGNGYMVWMDSNEKYIGQWRNNLQNGIGLHVWYEPKGELKYLKNRYIGEWKDGLRHGFGIFFYSNGSRYEGQWVENAKQGFGIFTFHDGTQYKGNFFSDKMTEYSIQGVQSNIDPNNLPVLNSSFNMAPKGGKASLFVGSSTQTVLNQGINPNMSTGTISSSSIAAATGAKDKVKNKLPDVKGFTTIIEDPGENPEYSKQGPTTQNNKQLDISIVSNANTRDYKKMGTNLSIVSGKKQLIPIDKKSITSTNSILVNNNTASKLGSMIKTGSTPIGNNNFSTRGTYKIPETINEEDESGYGIEQVVANRVIKQSEANPFANLLDISDILEYEPDIDKTMVEVQNVLLRYLSYLKDIYKFYSGNKEFSSGLNESNFTGFGSKVTNEEDSKISNKDVHKTPTISKNFPTKESKMDTKERDKEIIITEGININADIGYALEMKDLWKLLRDATLLTPEFTLADFNRLYFKGPRNYIEMFSIPDDLEEKDIYEYIICSTSNNKNFFNSKYLRNGIYGNYQNAGNINYFSYKINDKVFEFDIHSKRNIVLMRQFYESVVRIAYLRFQNSTETIAFKVKELIENNFKKCTSKDRGKSIKNLSGNKETSSLNSSIVDHVYKNFETVLEMIVVSRESELLTVFKQLSYKSKVFRTNSDITLSYRYFFENVILKDSDFKITIDKYFYINFINKYHSISSKQHISEENRFSLESIMYIENLMDIEMIFFEFCELICFIIRKYCLDNSMQERKEIVNEVYNKLKEAFLKSENLNIITNQKKYYFPDLPYHKEYYLVIQESERQRKEEEKREIEKKRVEKENEKMEFYFNRILEIPEEEEEEYEEEESEN